MIPPRLSKESASEIAGPIAKIINSSTNQRCYPVRWKMEQVTPPPPLFKKEDETKCNYRPVTVLPALNNMIYERLLAFQLCDFYRQTLSDFTSAYRRYFSCETALLRMTGLEVDARPRRISSKAYGVGEDKCDLLRDYLSDRLQRVKIGDTSSTWKRISRGVSRGSVLGPMLFNISMDGLFDHVTHTKLNMYVDDQQIYDSDVDPVEERITHD